MKWRTVGFSLLFFVAYACTTTQTARKPETPLHGIASWYGEEFAGRTTANGEIFDPTLLTAAHRTLPFGTVLDVTNPKTSQTVRVRVNDRGPYIGNRLIDLSYAAAQQIGLIEPGTGEVDLSVVRLGRGEREPPAPYEVRIQPPAEKVAIASGEPPRIDFPLPPDASAAPPSDFHVERETRRQVSADGRKIEDVPIGGQGAPKPVVELDRRPVAPPAVQPKQYVVQVGAFAVEANAKALQEQLSRIGQQSFVDHQDLFRVRIGPYATRDQALKTRTALEASGLSAMIVLE